MTVIHILNGDSLKERWPSELNGKLIVTRECLIDGSVIGDISEQGLHQFYENRAHFISGYPQCSADDYYLRSVPELNKITKIPSNSTVYCWFEEDLFCQTNFWFVIALLVPRFRDSKIYLVKPNKGNEYSFANMSNEELSQAFKQAQMLSFKQLTVIAQLWTLYQQGNYLALLSAAHPFKSDLVFIINVIKAQLARAPDDTGYGYPERQLLAIINELNTTEFSQVFKVFSERMGIYSFGDLQVKRMFDKLISNL